MWQLGGIFSELGGILSEPVNLLHICNNYISALITEQILNIRIKTGSISTRGITQYITPPHSSNPPYRINLIKNPAGSAT